MYLLVTGNSECWCLFMAGSFATATCMACQHRVSADCIRDSIMNQVRRFVSLHFAWGIAEMTCMLVTTVCVCLSLAALPHEPGCNFWEWSGADVQSVHRFCCYDNIHVHMQCYRLSVQCRRVSIGVSAIWTTFSQVYSDPILTTPTQVQQELALNAKC